MIVGQGIYSLGEAAQLVKITRARLSRWVNGYERAGVGYPALWESDMVAESDGESVSFADLMEARMIARFYERGIVIQAVREAIEIARQDYGLERPFSSQRFQTDGRRIFIEAAERATSTDVPTALTEINSGQHAFRSIVEPAFLNVDFDADGAVRWWPLGRSKQVVLDRTRSFGRPIDKVSGVPMHALYDALGDGEHSTSDYRSVAKLYEVPERTVREAERFRLQFAA